MSGFHERVRLDAAQQPLARREDICKPAQQKHADRCRPDLRLHRVGRGDNANMLHDALTLGLPGFGVKVPLAMHPSTLRIGTARHLESVLDKSGLNP